MDESIRPKPRQAYGGAIPTTCEQMRLHPQPVWGAHVAHTAYLDGHKLLQPPGGQAMRQSHDPTHATRAKTADPKDVSLVHPHTFESLPALAPTPVPASEILKAERHT